jgi:K(+)-stimulated pyrophosphate-energized sodium pump
MGQFYNRKLVIVKNWLGIEFVPFTIPSVMPWCSIIAMFNRVGGGIYTKAADMGADLLERPKQTYRRMITAPQPSQTM